MATKSLKTSQAKKDYLEFLWPEEHQESKKPQSNRRTKLIPRVKDLEISACQTLKRKSAIEIVVFV